MATKGKYTASTAFFEALYEAGVRYCFVNLGSDHPAIVEAFVKGRNEGLKQPEIITCPHEAVALAMADGYARVTGQPQCVLVHVDVGTQNLGSIVHDSSVGRVPVLIFAGLSPYTIEGEYRGSRTEYIHWLQDVPNQGQIISQYCRFSAELKAGKNIKQMVNRALSFAKSDPKGPVHLIGPREVMEEEIEPYSLNQSHWTAIEPAALPASGVQRIASALASAEEPLCIVGAAGRDHAAPGELVELADTIRGMRVLDTAGSDMSFPSTHRAWLGTRYGVEDSIKKADVILILQADVPYIPTQCKPRPDAQIFHIDVDPLKQLMPVFYIDALARYRADATTSLLQLNEHFMRSGELKTLLDNDKISARWAALEQSHKARLDAIRAQAKPAEDGTFGPSYLMSRVRALCPDDTIWCIEAVTNTGFVADQIQASIPGTYINCGGGGLGWSGGAALGIKMAADDIAKAKGDGNKPFITQVVGDGTYLFSVPSTVYWISQRYNLPILTIILNNKGWNAPRKSALLVHPQGYASRGTNEDLNISFAPSPDYAGIAHAASGGKVWAGRAREAKALEEVLKTAIEQVQAGNGAVVDAQLEGGQGGFGGGLPGKQGG